MKRSSIVIIIIVAVLAAVLGAYIGDRYYYSEKILPGYHIGRIDIGGKTREQAVDMLKNIPADDVAGANLFLIYDDGKKITRFEFKPSQAGIALLADESVGDAVYLSHKFGYLQQLYIRLSKKQKTVRPRFRIADEATADSLIGQIAAYIDHDPEDARFAVTLTTFEGDSKYKIFLNEGRIGKTVLIGETKDLLRKTLEEGNTASMLVVAIHPPKVSAQMLKNIPDPHVIGRYTTYYGTHDSPNRIHNIYLVASFVDNTFLSSGEIFSLLKPIGEFTGERGFREAYVIMGDELVPQYGGGTCQIATTLYNSVMMADLDVKNRVNHGMYFSIYPLGRDATVYPPYTDFKFRNNTGYPIVIQALPFKKGLTFRIIGHPTGKSVSFSYPALKYRYTTVSTTEGGSGARVEKKIRTSAFSAEVVRTVKKDGKIIKQETIYSFYKLHGDRQKVKIRRRESR
ncbi:MAG: VanW family protein [Candidatus Saganbacteria bacterium]|nr:VanW family protein [Candidatus Saganbacteria bacterium]